MKPRLSPNQRRVGLAAIAALSAVAMSLPIAAAGWPHTSYVLLNPGNNSVSMSGSTDDIRRARALRTGNEALLFVRQGGVAYVIRDPATLRAAREIFRPQEELGARQAELGSRQAALGAQQAALGAQQARLGALQADARPSEQLELGRQQEALGRQQDQLGQKQNALGEQQNALGQQQNRLARLAGDKFDALLADAIRRGVAQRVN